MSDEGTKRGLEQMFRSGFEQGYACGREGTSSRPPLVEITWNGRQPVIRIQRPTIRLFGRN